MKRHSTYSYSEEILNSITHGLGLIMGLVVCIFFIIKGNISDSWLVPFSLVLYMFGVCSSYAASTVYHSIPASKEGTKKIARMFDHAAIYWHIAGSYSPLTLIAMRTGGEPVWAWVIFSFVCLWQYIVFMIKPRHTFVKSGSIALDEKLFVDREEARRTFANFVNQPTRDYNVLMYYGIGGIGKSRLLAENISYFNSAFAHSEIRTICKCHNRTDTISA